MAPRTCYEMPLAVACGIFSKRGRIIENCKERRTRKRKGETAHTGKAQLLENFTETVNLITVTSPEQFLYSVQEFNGGRYCL